MRRDHSRKFRRATAPLAALLACTLVPGMAFAQPSSEGSTPREIVRTYESLADGVLALKHAEKNLVRAILAAAAAHGDAQLARARKAMADKDASAARHAVEAMAAAAAQMSTEGDNAVAAVRKRLIDGGYHHNAADEAKGIFDPGYVIVTREAKAKLLESSRAIGKMSANPDAAALEAEWKKAAAVVKGLIGSSK